MNDVKVDPFFLVKHLLLTFFNKQETVSYEQLLTFFGEFASYFEPGDVEGFFSEVNYIKRGHEMIDINEIAAMIRDDVEHFYH